MKCFSPIFLLFIAINSYAVDFELNPGGDDVDGTKYYTLVAKDNSGMASVDVALEGNANTAKIREHFVFTCKWGTAEGVKVGMSSRTEDGTIVVYSYYFFDSKLSNFFSKSYAVMNENKDYTPISLNQSVCERAGEGVKKDKRTGKDYIENYEVISAGPFALKGVRNVSIKYVTDNGMALVKESESGDTVVDVYKSKNNKSPVNLSVFYMNISSEMNMVSLMSWGGGEGTDEKVCYKVYAYVYDTKGKMSQNTVVNNDENLSVCEGYTGNFSYKNAVAIKEYINKKYNGAH